jgi:[ribosomal protein S5]-alanine N-acetyltransferase
MKTILETERLLLREMTEADYDALAAILQDAQTMYAYEGAFTDTETREWLDRQLIRYREDGFGLWAVILKETGEMIGQMGITMQPVEDEQLPEIGYLFNRAYWHKGYAAEAATACRCYAFDVLRIPEIYSIIRDTNIPSMNVAIRNGMTIRKRFVKHYRGVDMPHFLFGVRKPD